MLKAIRVAKKECLLRKQLLSSHLVAQKMKPFDAVATHAKYPLSKLLAMLVLMVPSSKLAVSSAAR